jgi:nucleoside-diphosphate-sugar epimerase
MANYEQMVDAFAGARYVIHTAVSVIFIEKVEWEYYEKNVLRTVRPFLDACSVNKVERVVVTSST